MSSKSALLLMVFSAVSAEGLSNQPTIHSSAATTSAARPHGGVRTGISEWKCFDKNHLRFRCNHVTPRNKQGSSLVVDVETEQEMHFYSHAHAISGELCDECARGLRKLLKNQRHFCIQGTNWSSTDGMKKKEYSWSLHRLKTSAGYMHFLSPN